jgi:hypothetical protein
MNTPEFKATGADPGSKPKAEPRASRADPSRGREDERAGGRERSQGSRWIDRAKATISTTRRGGRCAPPHGLALASRRLRLLGARGCRSDDRQAKEQQRRL